MYDLEKFWAGTFGDEYTARNTGAPIERANREFFKRSLRSLAASPGRIVELGANRGLNFAALKELYPTAHLTGVEINHTAYQCLRLEDQVEAVHGSLFQYESAAPFDLVLCKGVLIHIEPTRLREVYEKIYALSCKYILIAEYYIIQPLLKCRTVGGKGCSLSEILRGSFWTDFQMSLY